MSMREKGRETKDNAEVFILGKESPELGESMEGRERGKQEGKEGRSQELKIQRPRAPSR